MSQPSDMQSSDLYVPVDDRLDNIDFGEDDNKSFMPREDKTTSWARWPVLFLSCFAMFGSYYCFDNPSALQTPLQDRMNLSSAEYNLFYSVYSYPNIILPLLGGIVIRHLGANRVILICMICVLTGQGLFAMGVTTKSFAVSLIGRTVYGFGGETLSVAESTLLASWFKGKEVAFAMGINLTVSRLGSVANDLLSARLEESFGISIALWTGFFILCVCLASVLVLISFDIWATKRYGASQSEEDEALEENFKLSDLTRFSSTYWLITASCFVVYATVLPFNNVASSFLQTQYGYSKRRASFVMGIPFLLSAIFSPILGGIVDKIGLRAVLLLFSSIFLCVSHSLMAFTDLTPYFTLSILGIGYSIYSSAMWPAVAYVVPNDLTGTAYGLTTAIQNGGLASFPSVVGAIRDDTGSYKAVEVFFFAMALCGVVLGLLLNVVDMMNGNVLNSSNVTHQVVEEYTLDLDKENGMNSPLMDEAETCS